MKLITLTDKHLEDSRIIKLIKEFNANAKCIIDTMGVNNIINSVTKDIPSKYHVFDDFVTIRGLQNNQSIIDIVKGLQEYITPMYVHNSLQLSKEYSGRSKHNLVPVNPFRISIGHALSSDVKLCFYITVDDRQYTIYIDVPFSKSYSSVDQYQDEHCNVATYKNPKLHTKLTNLDTSIVQTWGSHRVNLNNYTVFFEDDVVTIEDIVENI